MEDFDLLSSLKEYKTPFDEEKAFVSETINFLETGKNQFFRTNFDKHIVAGVFLLNESKDKILLTHHKALGKWLQFGGHSDGESNSLNVAKRELFEESGIKNFDDLGGKIFDVDIHTIPENKFKNEPEHKHIEIRFLFLTSEEKFVVSDESDDLAWFKIEDFIKLLKEDDFYSHERRIVEKLTSFINKQ